MEMFLQRAVKKIVYGIVILSAAILGFLGVRESKTAQTQPGWSLVTVILLMILTLHIMELLCDFEFAFHGHELAVHFNRLLDFNRSQSK